MAVYHCALITLVAVYHCALITLDCDGVKCTPRHIDGEMQGRMHPQSSKS